MELSLKNILIIIAVIVIVVVLICILIYSSNKKDKLLKRKLVKYGGLFSKISNLNIGHPKNAPIFHARPYLGMKGIDEYLGAVEVPEGYTMVIDFPSEAKNYEVLTMSYPNWEQVGEILYQPSTYYLKYSTSGTKKVILVTGIGADSWLDNTNFYFTEDTPIKGSLTKLPIVDENRFLTSVDDFFSYCSGEWLSVNENYSITEEIPSTLNDQSFPPSSGIVLSVNYTPTSVDETIFIIYPNRKHTSGIESAAFIEVGGKRTYLTQKEKNMVAGVYVYNVETLSTIYIEERYLVSNTSSILPFYVYVARPTNV